MKKKFLLLFTLVALSSTFAFCQKAYDAIIYVGKTQNITVQFTLANGYISASEIKTTDNKTKKTSKFSPTDATIDNDKKMKFEHVSTSGKKFSDYFMLEGMEDNYETPPSKITGNYFFNGTAFAITLVKK